MIVKDKKEVLDRSNKLSSRYLKIIEKETRKFIEDNDPSSHIYFSVYCMSMSISKVALGIERFGQMYGINNLDSIEVINWILSVSKEIIKENSENVH